MIGYRKTPLIGVIGIILGIFFVTASAWAQKKNDPLRDDPLYQYEGKIVRSISIKVRDIFDEDNLSAPYRLVNSAKITTKEQVVRRELNYTEGDTFDTFLVRESERNLREIAFVREVETTVTVDGHYADILITVQDTWTLIPQFAVSSGDGRERRTFGIAESNLLGYGKRLELLYQEDEGQESLSAIWDDRRVWGTYHSALFGIFDRNDGDRAFAVFGRPFRTIIQKYAWQVLADAGDTIGRLFQNGDERFIFRRDNLELGANFTVASGKKEIARKRYTFGYTYYQDDFAEAKDSDFEDINLDPDTVSRDPALIAENRRYSGPTFRFSRVETDFISLRYIDRFERVEDFNLGAVYTGSLVVAPEALGSNDNYLIFSALTTQGHRFSRYSFARGEASVSGRYQPEGFENILARLEFNYFSAFDPSFYSSIYLGRHTIATQLLAEYGHDFDRNRELLLGGDNGLRGYDARTFTGDKRFVVNLEDRVHLVDDVFKFLSLGAAAFVDGGGTTSGSFDEIFTDNFYSDVGLGLRIGFPRSSRGRVVRVDVAFPLRDGPDGSDALEFRVIFSGGQLFNSLLQGDFAEQQRSTLSLEQ